MEWNYVGCYSGFAIGFFPILDIANNKSFSFVIVMEFMRLLPVSASDTAPYTHS